MVLKIVRTMVTVMEPFIPKHKRYRTPKERFMTTRDHYHHRRDRVEKQWYQHKHIIFTGLAIGLFLVVFSLMWGALYLTDRYGGNWIGRNSTLEWAEIPETVIEPEVMDGTKDMNYELAKKIFAGEVIGVTEAESQ